MTDSRTLRRILAPTALLLAALGVTACSSDPGPSSPAGAKENAATVKPTTTTDSMTIQTMPPVTDSTTTTTAKASTTLGPMAK